MMKVIIYFFTLHFVFFPNILFAKSEKIIQGKLYWHGVVLEPTCDFYMSEGYLLTDFYCEYNLKLNFEKKIIHDDYKYFNLNSFTKEFNQFILKVSYN